MNGAIDKKKNLLSRIYSKSNLKQEIYKNTLEVFHLIKKTVEDYELEYRKYTTAEANGKALS
ncbi:MAG: hypothetical protein GXO88_09790 [Chlorobi bacterium]|nr:hypothetical protein [Chlorobiota bacterium]